MEDKDYEWVDDKKEDSSNPKEAIENTIVAEPVTLDDFLMTAGVPAAKRKILKDEQALCNPQYLVKLDAVDIVTSSRTACQAMHTIVEMSTEFLYSQVRLLFSI